MESRFESLWIDTTPKTAFSSLVGTIEADVCIVGGGIAGLISAYFLMKAGKKVVVVEANRISTGTTAYTTAKVTSLHGAKYSFLKKNFGLKNAKIYASSQEWAIQKLRKIVAKEKIDCDLLEANAYLYTNESNKIGEMNSEYDVLKELGLSVSLVNEIQELPFAIKKALKLPHQVSFHPRKFLLAMAKILTENGCLIFENSPITSLTENHRCELQSETGKVIARDTVIATNYPIKDTNLLFTRMGQRRSYALAVEVNQNFGDDMYIGLGKDEFTLRSYRYKGKQILILGGQDHLVGDNLDTDIHHRKLEALARKQLSVERVKYKWSAQDTSPLDRVPYIGKLPLTKHFYITTGYGEWGMTTSIVSAQLLTDLILNKKNEWEKLYSPARLNIKASLGNTLEMWKQLVKGFSSYLTRNDSSALETMNSGEGRIINKNGEKIAVYKDKQNTLCALSAVCTHLHCIVEFNTAEQTWDCPCHGSRFATSGKVIRGPATKALEKKELSVK